MDFGTNEQEILSVSSLARQARLVLEERFHTVWVEGEISNFSRPGSGHWYFSLKDATAQIRCAFFAGRNRGVRFPVKNGLKVVVRGRISLYEGRGDFQIIVDGMEVAGEGALRAAFEALKMKLGDEGLFAADRKRSLAPLPRTLAIISSPTGAALQDVLSVIGRRYPPLEVILVPVAVQGSDAGPQIVAALQQVALIRPDIVLLTRGGGSLEDLWAFNLEVVARAIADCPIPVVSAIGHETDFTIADFVADVRAPTPSAAAELITPDQFELILKFTQLRDRLSRHWQAERRHLHQRLDTLQRQLVDPRRRLQQQMQRVDELTERLTRVWNWQRQQRLGLLEKRSAQLMANRPGERISYSNDQVMALQFRLSQAWLNRFKGMEQRLSALSRTLQAISPMATLDRGFAILLNKNGSVTSIDQTQPDDTLSAKLKDGTLDIQVLSINPKEPSSGAPN